MFEEGVDSEFREFVVQSTKNSVWFLYMFCKFMRGWRIRGQNAAFSLCENGICLKFLTSNFFQATKRIVIFIYLFLCLVRLIHVYGDLAGLFIKTLRLWRTETILIWNFVDLSSANSCVYCDFCIKTHRKWKFYDVVSTEKFSVIWFTLLA